MDVRDKIADSPNGAGGHLPIDLPAVNSFPDTLRPVLTKGDMRAFMAGILGTFCGGAFVWWIFA